MKKLCLLLLALLLCAGCTNLPGRGSPSAAPSSRAELPEHLLGLEQSLNDTFSAQLGPIAVVYTPGYEDTPSIFLDSYAIDEYRTAGQDDEALAQTLMDALPLVAEPVIQFAESAPEGYSVPYLTMYLTEDQRAAGQFTYDSTFTTHATSPYSLQLYGRQYPQPPPPGGGTLAYNTAAELPQGCNALSLLSVEYDKQGDSVYGTFKALDVQRRWDEATDETLVDITTLDEKVYVFPIEYHSGIVVTEVDMAGGSGASHFTAGQLLEYHDRVVKAMGYYPPLACRFDFNEKGQISSLTEI